MKNNSVPHTILNNYYLIKDNYIRYYENILNMKRHRNDVDSEKVLTS